MCSELNGVRVCQNSRMTGSDVNSEDVESNTVASLFGPLCTLKRRFCKCFTYLLT